LDTFNDKWAFIAVAMVQTKDLRPKGFPKFLGNDFFLIGYRVFVRYVSKTGKNLRGLYILKSETDKKKMEILGNIFTRYGYIITDINMLVQNGAIQIASSKSRFKIEIENPDEKHIDLPAGSPFADWKEARKFAGPLPFTFSYDSKTKKVLIVEGVRENWTPMPVKVLNYNFTFLDDLKLPQLTLANAFIINDVPYYWKKGKTEVWE